VTSQKAAGFPKDLQKAFSPGRRRTNSRRSGERSALCKSRGRSEAGRTEAKDLVPAATTCLLNPGRELKEKTKCPGEKGESSALEGRLNKEKSRGQRGEEERHQPKDESKEVKIPPKRPRRLLTGGGTLVRRTKN